MLFLATALLGLMATDQAQNSQSLADKYPRLTAAEQAEIEGRASAIQQERKVSREQALRLAREEKAREDRFSQLGQRLLCEAPESFAGVSSYRGRATFRFSRDPQAEFRRLVPAVGPRIFALTIGPWPVDGNQIGATYADASSGSLAAVRAELHAVDAAFDHASRKRGAPLQRRIVP